MHGLFLEISIIYTLNVYYHIHTITDKGGVELIS